MEGIWRSPPGMYKNLVNNGIFTAGVRFLPSTVVFPMAPWDPGKDAALLPAEALLV